MSVPEYLETTVDKFIFRVATDRLYHCDGVWAFWLESQGNGRAKFGLTTTFNNATATWPLPT